MAEEQQDEFKRSFAQEFALLAELYHEANQKREDDPLELQEKLTLYGQIYETMGELEAVATGQAKLAYAQRHEVSARTYMHRRYRQDVNKKDTTEKLSAKERDSVAELACTPYRRKEAKYAEESKRWQNRRESVLEQINIMKRRQDLFSDTWDKANFINGYQ